MTNTPYARIYIQCAVLPPAGDNSRFGLYSSTVQIKSISTVCVPVHVPTWMETYMSVSKTHTLLGGGVRAVHIM